jgi:uncharacterized membrane protein YhaH (DUF805 family)
MSLALRRIGASNKFTHRLCARGAIAWYAGADASFRQHQLGSAEPTETAMNGIVLGFDTDTHTGAISGDDGNRYDFALLDWRGPRPPRRADHVDFQAIDDRATEIQLLEPVYVQPTPARFYLSPSGRISRSQYWLKFLLPYLAVDITLDIASHLAPADSSVATTISNVWAFFSLLVVWPSIAVLIKRMHDRNRSGWLFLILLVPTLIFVTLLFTWVGPSLVEAAAGKPVSEPPTLDNLGITVVALGAVVAAIHLWFFIEFACLRGTIGANRFGADPVR